MKSLGKFFRDRRKRPRVLLGLPFEYWTQYNPHIRCGGIVLDASEIGFLIYSPEDMPIGTQLKIVVIYIWGYGLTNLGVWAEIVWKNEKKEGKYLYGLKLIEVFGENRNKLRGLLRHNSMKNTVAEVYPRLLCH
jgi:hypothetical protein